MGWKPCFLEHSGERGERLADEGENEVLIVWGQNLHHLRVVEQYACNTHNDSCNCNVYTSTTIKSQQSLPC